MADKKIIEQAAKDMPDMKDVKLKMQNLHLHASGVFSNVYKGTLLQPGGSGKEIAIKKTWPENRERNFEMIFLTGVSRERHKNIVQMLYAFSNKTKEDKVCESFVFDFMPDTLASVIKKDSLDLSDIKIYTWQLFTGLKYLSGENIVHRDIKPVNILIDHATGLLKIGDFGSAKIIHSGEASTAYQVTRFYRPPELLLGSTHYNWTVDLWSGGCVVGEMLKKSVLFAGRDGKNQLKLIFNTLGVPMDVDLRAMRVPTKLVNLPEEAIIGTGLGPLMTEAKPEAVAFLSKILVYKPKERLGGRDVLRHSFFDSILKEGARRGNGQLVGNIITPADVRDAQWVTVDKRQVTVAFRSVDDRKGSRLSALMNKKVEFAFGSEDKKERKKAKTISRSPSSEALQASKLAKISAEKLSACGKPSAEKTKRTEVSQMQLSKSMFKK